MTEEREDLVRPALQAALIIAVSIGFAVLMIVASHFLRGSEHRDTVVFLLMAAWWIPFTYLSLPIGKRYDRGCCRR